MNSKVTVVAESHEHPELEEFPGRAPEKFKSPLLVNDRIIAATVTREFRL